MIHPKSALFIYIEPTPYLLGLIRRIEEYSTHPLEVLFVAANVSQSWNLSLQGTPASFLPRGTLASTILIARKLATRRYRLVQLAGWWGSGILICALLLAWWYRVPVFVESDTQLPVGLPRWKRMVKRLVYPRLFRIPHKLFAAGSRQAAYFRHYGVPSERIVINRMTVDVTDIMRRSDAILDQGGRPGARKRFGFSAEQNVFIYVGRLESYKGIKRLLVAFDRLRLIHAQAALLIVGDGRERATVESAASTNDSVRYVGRLDYEQVVLAYNCADVSVVPSVIEPWGLVVNEAMAVGLPIIASDRVGCVDDLVIHGKTGLIYRADLLEDLGSCMARLLGNQNERIEMGKAGRRLIAGWTLECQARTLVEAWPR